MAKKILFFISFFYVTGCGCYQFKKSMYQYAKPLDFKGILKSKFLDSSQRLYPNIILENGDSYPMDAFDMYEELQAGDSVVKKAGSLKYTLIRKGEVPRYFYPKCDGNEIK